MASGQRQYRALTFALLLATLGAPACSKSSSPTSPYGGGGTGGGGTGPQFNFGPFAVGQSAKFTFSNAGTVGYHCVPHRGMGMVGTVQVDASGADSLVVQIAPAGNLTFTPSTAHIKPGGYVRWVDVTGTVHTVTTN